MECQCVPGQERKGRESGKTQKAEEDLLCDQESENVSPKLPPVQGKLRLLVALQGRSHVLASQLSSRAFPFCLQTSIHFGLSAEERHHHLCALKLPDRWNSQPIVHKMGGSQLPTAQHC